MDTKKVIEVLERRIKELQQPKTTTSTGAKLDKEEVEALQQALSLCEDYEAMSAGMPEEKKLFIKPEKPKNSRFNKFVEGFNQARHLCILAALKMLDVEKIANSIRDYIKQNDLTKQRTLTWVYSPMALQEFNDEVGLAQVVHNHIFGEKSK